MEHSSIKVEIEKRYPDITFIDASKSMGLILEFAVPTQKEYKYYAAYSGEVGASVGAILLDTKEEYYFWYYPFDPYGSNSAEEKEEDSKDFLIEQLDILTKYKTRIVQKNNWLTQSFVCEYFENNSWVRYYKHLAFKTSFKFPPISTKRRIYM